MKMVINKIILFTSMLTAVLAGFLFEGDTISFDVAWKVIAIASLIFFINLYILIKSEQEGFNPKEKHPRRSQLRRALW